MNERIKELYLEATEQFTIVQEQGLPAPYQTRAFAEKFAELIVRECIEVVDNRSKKDFHPTSYGGELLHYVTTDLKQHFGVEE
jgi:hypothetical protein